MQNAKKKIAVFYTGGTISMRKDDGGGVNLQSNNPLTSGVDKIMDDFLNANNIELVQEQVFGAPIPSSYMTEQRMLQLRSAILEKINSEKVNGVVVTHGTDTLEETAYFLDITIDSPVPVVVTGSMRSADALGSDAVYNYQCAIRVAASDEAKGMGAMVVLNGDIHAARSVTKTHTTNLATFQSPGFGTIGAVMEKRVAFARKLTPSAHYDVKRMTKNVILVKAFAGMNSLIFESIEALGEKRLSEGKPFPIDGLVIEAFGAGNLCPAIVDGLKKMEARKIPIVLASRCLNGSVQDIYEYEGGGKSLKMKEMKDIVFSNGLSGQKARIKLAVLLEKTSNPKEIEEEFGR